MKKLVSLLLATLLIVFCLAGLTFAADPEAKWTNGTTTVEGTLAEMGKQAGEQGGTITLLKDVEFTAEKGYLISAKKSFTLDLGGKTITSNAYILSVDAKADGVTVIKNGTMIANNMAVVVKGGGLVMQNVTAWGEKGQAVAYYDTTGKWNKENIIENCTFGSAVWGAFAFNNTAESQAATAMTIKNSTLLTTKEKSNPIVIQSKAVSANLVLGEGVKMYAHLTGDKNYANGGLKVTGEEVTMSADKVSVSVLDKSATLTEWTTPATATKTLEIPGAAAPSAPAPTASGGPEAKWSNDLVTVEGTLAEMGKQAGEKGGTITLLKDVHFDADKGYLISAKKSFTLDLGGKTITSNAYILTVDAKADGVTVIKNGTMIANNMAAVIKGGGLVMQNVTAWGEIAQAVAYYDTTGKYNAQNLIENCTFGSAAWGAFAFNNTAESQAATAMTFKNSTLVTTKEKSPAIVIQSKAVTANLVLGEGVKMYAHLTGDKGFASTGLTVLGESAAMSADKVSVSVLDKSATLTEWTTPATATVDLTAVTPVPQPAEPEKPATPATPATPSASAETEKQEEDRLTAPSYTVVEEGAPVGLIVGIVAAVLVVAAVIVVVAKKKKK